MNPVDNPTSTAPTHEAESASLVHSDATSERARPASSYIVLPHRGRAPKPTASRVPYPGGDAVRRGRPEPPSEPVGASQAASRQEPTTTDPTPEAP